MVLSLKNVKTLKNNRVPQFPYFSGSGADDFLKKIV